MLLLKNSFIIQKFQSVKMCSDFKRLFSFENISTKAKEIYEFSVKAAQPGGLVKKFVKVHSNYVDVNGETFPINKNIYVIGFGKAVLNMALTLENILKEHIVSGIISVPVGIQNNIIQNSTYHSKIQIFEGAENNIPDENSLLAANKIIQLVTSLEKSSLLFVLISGGGSALLPSPRPPMTLKEKQTVIKLLASEGATIEEINSVRKKISLLKGGGLAQLAKPAQVISLILSDIIGDPLSMIASGPTVKNTDHHSLPISIIEKYNLKSKMPLSAIKLLENISEEEDAQENFDFVRNFIIGNNTLALNAAVEKATELLYMPFILTNRLQGIARDVGHKIIQMIDAALNQNENKYKDLCKELFIDVENENNLLENAHQNLCLLLGGETIVNVTGNGTGGRNQELALAASIELNKIGRENILLLSAGTDGIDGPTSAAGAIATPFIVSMARKENLDIEKFLKQNDSYNFYNSLNNGKWHVKIGHTGTNVMDIIIVLIHF